MQSLGAKKLVVDAQPSPRSKEEAWEWALSDLIGRRRPLGLLGRPWGGPDDTRDSLSFPN
jgi:hypothetical protein